MADGRRRWRRRAPGLAGTCAVVVLVAGCGSRQSTTAPESHAAREIDGLWWDMMIGAWAAFGVIVVLLVVAYLRRRRDDGERGERAGWAVVVTTGLALPILVVTAVFVAADLVVVRTTQAPAARSTDMTVEVVGHQWWWEFRYPGGAVVTANEMHIPTRTRVDVVVTTDDVIHSFWVPQLNRKIDTIPGRRNRILLEADRPGRYRGQCAEYCGLQHAHMAMEVVAERPARFRVWLAAQARPSPPPATAQERAGYRIVTQGACSACHAIAGTPAQARVGPDLTHVASRRTLAGLAIANTPAGIRRWITRGQEVKPGNQMPQFPLPQADLDAVAAYLGTLR